MSKPEGLSPKEEIKQSLRKMSDSELIKQGAKYVPDNKGGTRLEVAEEQIETIGEEMSLKERLKKLEGLGEKGLEVIEGLTGGKDFQYVKELVEDDSPENYIWELRRILRSTLQGLERKLLETGKVTTTDRAAINSVLFEKNATSSFFYELTTKDPVYYRFVYAFNHMRAYYDALYNGSEDILTNRKQDF